MYSLLGFQYSNCIFADSVDTLHAAATFPNLQFCTLGGQLTTATHGQALHVTFLGKADRTVAKEAAVQGLRSLCWDQLKKKTEAFSPKAHSWGQGIQDWFLPTHRLRKTRYLVPLLLEVGFQSHTD